MATPVYSTSPLGVNYIKIARYDANGNDNSISLRELRKVKIRTNDAGIVEYPVITITEYSTYFLYQTVATNITSTTNNQILNYRVQVQNTVAFTFDPTGAEFSFINSYDIESFDSLNYLNATNGKYILGNTPNIPIIITASADWNNNLLGSPATNPIISLRKIIGPTTDFTQIILQKSSSAAALSGTVTLSGSFFPIEGETYGIYVSSTSPSNPTRFTGITLILTQSATPVAGIGAQTILEPYITTPFINSDYNPFINNAYVSRTSTTFMDVDYAGLNQVTPINLRSILASSATPASVQDSNYTTRGIINSRYRGKQLQSFKFNKYTEGDISYGKTPNISNPQTYFIQFNWLAGTLPEWGTFGGESKIYSNTGYIIDENGNNIKPINDPEGVNLSIIKQTFEEGKNAVIQLSNPEAFGTNMSSLEGTFPIFKSGKKIKPIIYTQIAQFDSSGNVNGYSYTGSINFVNGNIPNNPLGASVNNYTMVTSVPSLDSYTTTFLPNRLFEVNNGIVQIYGPREVSFNPPIQLGLSASFNTSPGTPSTGSRYRPTGSLAQLSSLGYILYLELYLKVTSNLASQNLVAGFDGYDELSNLVRSVNISFELQKSEDGGGSWYPMYLGENSDSTNPSDPFTFTIRRLYNQSNENTSEIYLNVTDNLATTSSVYRIIATPSIPSSTPTPSDAQGVIQIADGSYFKVSQYPSPSTGNVTNFWMTGSVPNYLYAKKGTGGNAGLNDVFGQKQQNIENSGFDSITLDFEPQIGDEIRFIGTELQTYKITQVTQSITSSGAGNYNALTLVLDRNLTQNIDINYFLLRRYVDDVGSIILSTTKPAGGTSTGVMKPEYVTSQIEKVINRTIINLLDQ